LQLTFHGAAGCVTGFCARLQADGVDVLVDCGMFQGPKTLKALNYGDFPFDPRKLDAVLLTHAHLDHSGLLPKLVRAGFGGRIFATGGTRDLARVLLANAAEIQENEVEHLNRRNQQRGRPLVEPIYTPRDVAPTLALFQTVKLGEAFEAAPGLQARYWDAGHILGSASIELTVEGQRLLFSGDLGAGGRDFLRDPEGPAGIDHLVLESTYGDRERPMLDGAARRRLLAQEMKQAHGAGGPVLIPAFAVERSQELLTDIVALMEDGEIPEGEIFLDSPLAIEATEVFLRRGWNREAGKNPFEPIRTSRRIRFLEKPWESDGLDRLRGWHIILAGSGMCDAGRVRKHLKRLLWRREATVLITGFQASGTLGRLLLDGRKLVRIQGDDVRVRARVRSLDIYSGHADAAGLVRWAQARRPIGGAVFLAHGEPSALKGLERRLTDAGMSPQSLVVPDLDQSFTLRKEGPLAAPAAAPRLRPEAVVALDWHNARAAFLGDLDEALQGAATDEARTRLLKRLEADLGRRGV
jgi:metallo-beta-lactamase family protein